MQAVFTQVPPNAPRWMSATRMPALVSRCARNGPAWPVPMMIASYVALIPASVVHDGSAPRTPPQISEPSFGPPFRCTEALCIVRCRRSASYGLLRTDDHPVLLFAVNLHGFLRPTPFDGVLFRVEDGKLAAEGYE